MKINLESLTSEYKKMKIAYEDVINAFDSDWRDSVYFSFLSFNKGFSSNFFELEKAIKEIYNHSYAAQSIKDSNAFQIDNKVLESEVGAIIV